MDAGYTYRTILFHSGEHELDALIAAQAADGYEICNPTWVPVNIAIILIFRKPV